MGGEENEAMVISCNYSPIPPLSPLPKILEGGKEAGKQESAGKTTCGFLFSDYLLSNLCR